MTQTHKHLHYSCDRRRHQSQWLLAEGYKNNIDSRSNMNCYLLFSQRIYFNDHCKSSISFIDSLSAVSFLLEVIYDAQTQICFSAQTSQNSFRTECTFSLGAVYLLIQAKVAVLSTLRCTEVSDNVVA